MSGVPMDAEAPRRARQRREQAAVKLALGLLWRGGHRSRVVHRIARVMDGDGYRGEIDALRARLQAEYRAAIEHGAIERGEPEVDLDAALLVALHYFHAKETPPLPLPPGLLESTGDLLRYFAGTGSAGR